MAKGIKRKLTRVRDEINAQLAVGYDDLGKYGRAMQREGYVGGYLQALADVQMALDGIPPDINGRFCHLWEKSSG